MCMYKDLNMDPQKSYVKKSGMVASTCNLSLKELEPWGSTYQPTYVNLQAVASGRDPVSENKTECWCNASLGKDSGNLSLNPRNSVKDGRREQTSQVVLWPTYLSCGMCAHAYIYTTHTQSAYAMKLPDCNILVWQLSLSCLHLHPALNIRL